LIFLHLSARFRLCPKASILPTTTCWSIQTSSSDLLKFFKIAIRSSWSSSWVILDWTWLLCACLFVLSLQLPWAAPVSYGGTGKTHGRGLTRSASRVSDEGHGKENGAGRCSQHLSG